MIRIEIAGEGNNDCVCQQDMNDPRLGALPNNRRSGGIKSAISTEPTFNLFNFFNDHRRSSHCQERWTFANSGPLANMVLPGHLLLDRSPNIGSLISCWELDKFKNCWNKTFRTSKIPTLLYQQFSNLLISRQDMSALRLGALSNNRWSRVLSIHSLLNSIGIHVLCTASHTLQALLLLTQSSITQVLLLVNNPCSTVGQRIWVWGFT